MSSNRDDLWLNEALIEYSTSRDAEIRGEIVVETMWLAARAARRFSDRGEPFDDLVQVANIGLLKALDRYDPSLGVPFAAFATPTIMGEIRRYFRDHTWSLRVPRRAKDLLTALTTATEELSAELGRSPKVPEIAERVGASEEAVLECLEANMAYNTRSIDLPGNSEHVVIDPSFAAVIDKEVVTRLLDRLPSRERKILELRFFDELNQTEIAAKVGTSQVHVGRLLTSSLSLLRQYLEDEDEEPAAQIT